MDPATVLALVRFAASVFDYMEKQGDGLSDEELELREKVREDLMRRAREAAE